MYFTKQKHKTIFYKIYKKLDNLKFNEALNRELTKHDLNNTDHEIFHEIVLSILIAHAPLKMKHLSKSVKSSYKESKAKKHFKKRTESTEPVYNYQRNVCVSLLKKLKRSYF